MNALPRPLPQEDNPIRAIRHTNEIAKTCLREDYPPDHSLPASDRLKRAMARLTELDERK